MRNTPVVTLFLAMLTMAPLATQAGTPDNAKAQAVHATTGTVKTIDATTLVISRSKKAAADLTFTLNGSTRRDGNIVVGAPVSVRYEDEGKSHVATAVAVRPASNVTAHN